ncbi:3-dehydroquinate dehydratase [compost metagenome]
MNEQFADRPIITMSMAGKGMISRLAGELFGSALTFGSAKKASAPGQLPVAELRGLLELMHRNL